MNAQSEMHTVKVTGLFKDEFVVFHTHKGPSCRLPSSSVSLFVSILGDNISSWNLNLQFQLLKLCHTGLCQSR